VIDDESGDNDRDDPNHSAHSRKNCQINDDVFQIHIN